jgi:starvation-inducible DNA-binding protein
MKKRNNHHHGDASPHLSREGSSLQEFGTVVAMPNGLKEEVCRRAALTLNALLADTITLRDLYKKHHWQVAGPTFYPLHLMFDKHADGQSHLVDALAERIQLLGGVSVAMAPDVAEMTRIDTPPSGREPAPVQLSRLIEAHEVVLKAAHDAADNAAEDGDHGTNDLLASQLIPANEMQLWFVSQHLVDSPLIENKERQLTGMRTSLER